MKIKCNNISFGAYFKNDKNNNLKNLYNDCNDKEKLKELTKELKENCPNHELEIVEKRFVRGTEENPKINWREATRSMHKYRIQNNTNGRNIWICTPIVDNHLTQITKEIINLKKNGRENFWNDASITKDLFNSLTTPNSKQVNIETNKSSQKSFIEKFKDCFNFWTK